ncbi:MAG: hypothetical protein EBS05_26415 [Proteobacteria bacterium]|nr:hypothetical protein [Pseudomonadota bacterium]
MLTVEDDATKSQFAKFQTIVELIKQRDEEAADLFRETGRSTLPRLKQLGKMRSMKLLNEDLVRFSPEAMMAVSAFADPL